MKGVTMVLRNFIAITSLMVGLSCHVGAKAKAATDEWSRVFVDLDKVMSETTQGKKIASWAQDRQQELQKFALEQEETLRSEGQGIMAANLDEEEIQMQAVQFDGKRKKIALDIEQKRASLEAELRSKQTQLRKSIEGTVKDLAMREKWAEVSTNKQGLIFVADQFDKTAMVLDEQDKVSEKQFARSVLHGGKTSARASEFLKA
jgi:hypothetical protein